MKILLFLFYFIASIGTSIGQKCEDFSLSAEISPSCIGQNNGSIKLLFKKGVPPYEIQWKDGFSDIRKMALSSGKYTVIVTDKAGCKAKASFTVDNYPSINLDIDQTNRGAYTDVELRITGGGPQPLSVMWINAEGRLKTTSRSLIGAKNGSYIAIVTDGHNCSEIIKFRVE